MAELYQIETTSVMMRLEPQASSQYCNELLYGEVVKILDEEPAEWIKIRAKHDGYEGFIPASAIGSVQEPQHRVYVPVTYIYEDPDFKSPALSPLFMGSRISTSDEIQNGWRGLKQGGWVFDAHLKAIDSFDADYIETALKFKDAPYMWGGRSYDGIDCSGLVQLSLMEAGIACPRDTKDQIENIGHAMEVDKKTPIAGLQRGDFVFFDRHVGIMVDDTHILNATARHMQTVIEPVDTLIADYKEILAVRRI